MFILKRILIALLQIGYIAIRVSLRFLLGKQARDRFLKTRDLDLSSRMHKFRLRVLMYPKRRVEDLFEVSVPDGVLIEPDGCDLIHEEIYILNVYNRFYKIKDGDTVIDIGSHIGIFTLKAARRTKRGLVISIEPYPKNFKILLKNVKNNKLKNVIAVNSALSNCDGVGKLYIAPGTSGASHSLLRSRVESSEFVEVLVRKLDSLLDELNIKKVNMIKIDAEGSELEILEGAEKTLRDNNVHLAIAAYHTKDEIRKLSKFLTELGYKGLASLKYVYAWKTPVVDRCKPGRGHKRKTTT